MRAKLRKFAGMTPPERRHVVWRQCEQLRGRVLFGGLGSAVNASNRVAYLSYVPERLRTEVDHRLLARRWMQGNAQRNAGDIPRMIALHANAERVLAEHVEGDFAELGVHKGHSARLLADVLVVKGNARRLHVFDTFGGFDTRDLVGVDEGVPVALGDVTLRAVKDFVGTDRCDYYPGYFPETAEAVTPTTRFALVHIDCDLYEPTIAGLTFFYPRLSPGALLLLHDYASPHWPGVSQAVDEFLVDKPEWLVILPDRSGTAVFRKT